MMSDGVAYWNDTTAWEMGIEESLILTPKDSTEVIVYDTLTVVDTLFVYEYDTTNVIDTIFEYVYDSVKVDSTVVYEYAYDSTKVLDSTITYVYDSLVADSTITYVYDSVKVDSTVTYIYDSENVITDSTYVYVYAYDTTKVLDSTVVYEYADDTTKVLDSTVVYEYAYDTTKVVDSVVDYVYADDTTKVLDSTIAEYVYDLVKVVDFIEYVYADDTTKVLDSTYVYVYDSANVVIDSTLVYTYDSLVVDSTIVYLTEIESTVKVDTNLVVEYTYDSTVVIDTVGILSPIRSSQDDSLKHALRLWWPTPDNPETISLDPTNFCAWMPPHKENGFGEFDYTKQYTGSYAGTAGDYLTLFGVTAYPSIAVDPAGNLAVAYSSPDLNRALWNNAYYYRSIFVNYKPADSARWEQMTVYGKSLYEDFVHSGDEATFISAVSTPVNENEFWFSCLSDDTPGFHTGSVTSQANITTSIVNVFKYNPTATITDAEEEIGVNETMDVVYNIFPNPASEYICISSSMDANATVTFTNIAGQTVKVVNKNLTTGNNSIVVSDLTSGIYFCTVTANGYSHTSKVVVK